MKRQDCPAWHNQSDTYSLLLGFLHDASNNWALPLIILIGIAGLCLFAGLGASRDLYVSIAVDNESTHEFYTSNKD
ncbi:hypothetical protein [Clostridium thailandense]|uniref:hypothetical protein n=1 Tax=Clostridium thailandense TaxID=2794346 RepID=UPI0035E4193D